MTKMYINPQAWSLGIGYSQAIHIEGARRQLIISGQAAVDVHGTPICHGDMRGQMASVVGKLHEVLEASGMQFGDVVQMRVYSTDIDATLEHWDVVKSDLDAAGIAPAMVLVGVERLALPPFMFEIEAYAFG